MRTHSPRVLIVQNDEQSGPAALEPPLRSGGAELSFWLPGQGQPPPPSDDWDALIALGGRVSPDDDSAGWLEPERELLRSALAEDKPVLGICLGAQLLVQVIGGSADKQPGTELGWTALSAHDGLNDDPLLGGLSDGQRVFQWHYYGIHLPPGAAPLATTSSAVQAFRAGQAAWGVQFHAEIDLSTAALWLVAGADQLRERRIEPSALRQETAARGPENERSAAELGRRLLALCV